MNANKALDPRMLHVQWGCYLFLYSPFKNIRTRPFFHFVGSTKKVSRVKGKHVYSCLGITYLTLRISNPVGAKLSRWRFGINSFGANWDLRRSCTQRGHCLAGAKLYRWYFGIISFRRQLSSTYKFCTM